MQKEVQAVSTEEHAFGREGNPKKMTRTARISMAELKQRAELMKKHPGMQHDEPYMAHVAPGMVGKLEVIK